MGADEKHAATYHGGEYAPDTATIRTFYTSDTDGNPIPGRAAQFNRWLETVRAEAKAQALNEAADALNPELINYRRDAMNVLNQRIQPAGGNDTLSLQLALITAKRSRDWLRDRANQYKEDTANGR